MIDNLIASPRFALALNLVGIALSVVALVESGVTRAIVSVAVLLVLTAGVLYYLLSVERSGRNYETSLVSYHWEIDRRPPGSRATLTKRLSVRFLTDTRAIAELVDTDSASPDPLSTLTVDRGRIVEKRSYHDTHIALIAVEGPEGVRRRGDTSTYVFTRESDGAFEDPSEESVTCWTNPLTRRVSIEVLLPANARCDDAWLLRSQGHPRRRTVVADHVGGGRMRLQYSGRPRLMKRELFELHWRWT